MNVLELAKSVQPFVVEYRRDIHRHPELSFQEFRTTDRICEELDKMGVSYRRMEPTGVLAEIKGGKGPGKTVLLRGDIDALPVKEETGLEFASENDGCMHACGHDTHNAMLMGAVKAINSVKDEFAGTVKFIFQPAEETGQGAKAMIKGGCLDGVDWMFGTHIASMTDLGKVETAPGPTYASAFWFKIKITGVSSHGADPYHGRDAAVAGSAVVMALQDMVAREYQPTDPMVVTVGDIHAPGRFNIIPGEYRMEGTIRTFSREINATLEETLNRIAKGVASAYRCTADVELIEVAEVCENDPDAFEIGKAAIEKVVPGGFVMAKPTMGGEDFAYYTPHVKACFFGLGAKLPDAEGKVHPMHSGHVLFDERAFETGVALYIQVAMDALEA
ncbi:MAG: amidohydrolase [Solobacterium sp.]|nr:amidohydrolase [Solobacterium sp.]MBQ2688824.1 amidohydrolase [Solobacterium sp.]MBR0478905.1 amidohydrolase [Solobacterium sp.]MBR2727838.1 amidohydrolase [Solobacterium sp.]